MAHKKQNTCYVCGTEFEYCEHCALVKPNYNAKRFCCQAHQDIFGILSKHGCNLVTAEEALEALADYDLVGLTESIQKHIDSLQPKKVEVEEKSEAPAEEIEEVETKSKKISFRTHE